jgi:RNA-directed DNA polymerase
MQSAETEQPVVAMKSAKAEGAKGLRYPALTLGQLMEDEPMHKAKQFVISQTIVQEAFARVKANKGSAGVDGQSIEEFEQDLEKNLYKLWNRMSSGTYFPPPVKCVEIPKKGGVRRLGVPTVADRVAQMIVKLYLEPEVEPKFHKDSYGYRPNKSALDAVATAKGRCLERAWVIDLDLQSFFDMLDHTLVLEMTKKHTDCKWILLYVERWLKAPIQLSDGTLAERNCGSPQGSVVSPLLSNIVLHHVFDNWLATSYPNVPFTRYADDALVHCETRKQADYLRDMISRRFSQHLLKVHPQKTKIVYCKDWKRTSSHEHEQFDFLGYTFRPRLAKTKDGRYLVGFIPAMSTAAGKKIRATIRGWQLNQRSDKSLVQLAKEINPYVHGWINYYGKFYKTAMRPTLERLDTYLVRWAMRKYKRFHNRPNYARRWLTEVALQQPLLFAHWKFGVKPHAG